MAGRPFRPTGSPSRSTSSSGTLGRPRHPRHGDDGADDADHDRGHHVVAVEHEEARERHGGDADVVHARDREPEQHSGEGDAGRTSGRRLPGEQGHQGPADGDEDRQRRQAQVVGHLLTRHEGQHGDEVERPHAAAQHDAAATSQRRPPRLAASPALASSVVVVRQPRTQITAETATSRRSCSCTTQPRTFSMPTSPGQRRGHASHARPNGPLCRGWKGPGLHRCAWVEENRRRKCLSRKDTVSRKVARFRLYSSARVSPFGRCAEPIPP